MRSLRYYPEESYTDYHEVIVLMLRQTYFSDLLVNENDWKPELIFYTYLEKYLFLTVLDEHIESKTCKSSKHFIEPKLE